MYNVLLGFSCGLPVPCREFSCGIPWSAGSDVGGQQLDKCFSIVGKTRSYSNQRPVCNAVIILARQSCSWRKTGSFLSDIGNGSA